MGCLFERFHAKSGRGGGGRGGSCQAWAAHGHKCCASGTAPPAPPTHSTPVLQSTPCCPGYSQYQSLEARRAAVISLKCWPWNSKSRTCINEWERECQWGTQTTGFRLGGVVSVGSGRPLSGLPAPAHPCTAANSSPTHATHHPTRSTARTCCGQLPLGRRSGRRPAKGSLIGSANGVRMDTCLWSVSGGMVMRG